MVEWETGELTEESLSIIAADNPVTCAAYAKKHNLLYLPGWKRFRNKARNQNSQLGLSIKPKLDRLEDLPHTSLAT